jgi:hypothetical protein
MFNIREFKVTLDRYSGPAVNSLFVVEIANDSLSTDIRNTMPSRDLRFFCQTVTVPGINLEVVPYRPSGIGFPEYMPMSSAPDTLNCVFMLDSDHKIITFFHRWINAIIGVGSGDVGSGSREINYKTEYTVSMNIKHFSTFQKNNELASDYYEYKFYGVYPTQVGGITLSWNDKGVSTSSVNFTYSRIEHGGFKRASGENSRFVIGAQDSIIRGGIIPQNIINNAIV